MSEVEDSNALLRAIYDAEELRDQVPPFYAGELQRELEDAPEAGWDEEYFQRLLKFLEGAGYLNNARPVNDGSRRVWNFDGLTDVGRAAAVDIPPSIEVA